MKKFIYLAFICLITTNVYAQDTATVKAPSLAIKVGLLDFKKTNHTDGLTTTSMNFGFEYLQGVTKKVDVVANMLMSSLRYPYYTSLKMPTNANALGYFSFDIGLNYKFLTDEKPVVPYVTGGMGVAIERVDNVTGYAPVGAGLQIKANRGSFIFIQATHNAETSAITKKHNHYSIAYSLPLRGKDKKPVLLPPAPVSIDTDNDGVVDSLDKCPTQAGTAKYNGCPIPDTDKDGINDEEDKCPTQVGTAKYKGCPIPDTDKDGVNDEEDKCPTEAGIAANHGCEDIQPMLNDIANSFKFAIGKTNIAKKTLSKLDAVVAALNRYQNVHLDIIGNTDNTGKKKINQPLSVKRAAVVYNYLVKKGVVVERLAKQGVADSNPIESNKTSKGRAKNRRTDMKANY